MPPCTTSSSSGYSSRSRAPGRSRPSRSKNSSIQLGVPEMLVTCASSDSGASVAILRSQSSISARSRGGNVRARAHAGMSAAAMPERSPAVMPGASVSSAVLPPSRKLRPAEHATFRPRGKVERQHVQRRASVRARIAGLTGMRLVAAPVVPEVIAKKGMAPGQVTSRRRGKARATTRPRNPPIAAASPVPGTPRRSGWRRNRAPRRTGVVAARCSSRRNSRHCVAAASCRASTASRRRADSRSTGVASIMRSPGVSMVRCGQARAVSASSGTSMACPSRHSATWSANGELPGQPSWPPSSTNRFASGSPRSEMCRAQAP